MSDLIERQAAIDALEWKWAGKAAIDAIKNLPSAEPELDEWCTDCKEYDQKRHCCPRFRRVIRETVEDVRQNALTEVVRCKDCSRFGTRTDGSVYCYNGMSIGNKNDYCSYAERRKDGTNH